MLHRFPAKFIAPLAAAAAIGASVPATAPAADHPRIQAVAAKSCRGGRWGRIDGKRKCLKAGEFCKRRDDRQYRRYGFRCIRYYRNVHRYRLTHA